MTKPHPTIALARKAWADSRQRGASIQEAIEEMKPHKFGIGIVLRVISDAESMDIEEIAHIIDKRGDFEEL
jgi:hypothetical protein